MGCSRSGTYGKVMYCSDSRLSIFDAMNGREDDVEPHWINVLLSMAGQQAMGSLRKVACFLGLCAHSHLSGVETLTEVT